MIFWSCEAIICFEQIVLNKMYIWIIWRSILNPFLSNLQNRDWNLYSFWRFAYLRFAFGCGFWVNHFQDFRSVVCHLVFGCGIPRPLNMFPVLMIFLLILHNSPIRVLFIVRKGLQSFFNGSVLLVMGYMGLCVFFDDVVFSIFGDDFALD